MTTKATALFGLVKLARKLTSQDWWNYVGHVAAGKRAPSRETISGPVLEPGHVLNATDRSYVVTETGAWRRLEKFPREERLPASKSQIRLLPPPGRNKYTNQFSPAPNAASLTEAGPTKVQG